MIFDIIGVGNGAARPITDDAWHGLGRAGNGPGRAGQPLRAARHIQGGRAGPTPMLDIQNVAKMRS